MFDQFPTEYSIRLIDLATLTARNPQATCRVCDGRIIDPEKGVATVWSVKDLHKPPFNLRAYTYLCLQCADGTGRTEFRELLPGRRQGPW